MEGVWQLIRGEWKQEGSGVGFLFALPICARPLAGPPVPRAGPACAPDRQASALQRTFVELPGNYRPLRLIKSQPADSLASHNPNRINGFR